MEGFHSLKLVAICACGHCTLTGAVLMAVHICFKCEIWESLISSYMYLNQLYMYRNAHI